MEGRSTAGCWYHYSAALRRRLRKEYVLRMIADNSESKAIYQKLLSLPLLPHVHILEECARIKEEARATNHSNVFKYFDNYWINSVRYCISFKIHFQSN